MKKIKKLLKENLVFIIFLIFMMLLCWCPVPYYIDGPGGLTNLNERYKIKGEYSSTGSINMTYVSEYKATIASYLFAKINKNLDLYKKETIIPKNSNEKEENYRGKLMFKEALDNSIIVAYRYSNSDIKILKEKIYVSYIYEKANTNLKVGDQVIKIDSKEINSEKQLREILKNKEETKIEIIVVNNNKKEKKYAYVDNKGKINMLINTEYILDLNPKLKYEISNNEYGSSGGLMTSLAIYNKLVKEDITNGLVISGTGTIDIDGNVGSIDGVKYKLSGAVKNKADIFIVPSGKNYEEAMKYKKKRHYKIKIISVKTFSEALDKLKRE